MAKFFPVLFWGLTALAALTGWGRLLARKPRNQIDHTADWLEAPAWGIAISSLVGGLMNLCGIATRMGVAVFVFVGCALLAFSLFTLLRKLRGPAGWRLPPPDWKWLALLALPLAALALRFCGSVLIDTYFPYSVWSEHSYLNPQDDSLSYLVSPERMLQTGSLGLDPFNSRQMMSALGAQHFLNALALAIFAPEHVHIIEGGVGLAAACLAAAGLGMRLPLGRSGATMLMLVPLIFRPWYINISSTTTTVAVLIALCSALVQLLQADAPYRRWLVTGGLLLGAACSLKSTTIPTAGFLVAASAGLSALTQKTWRPLALGLLLSLVALLAMAPWMWWQYRSSGTPLYPLLGRGFHVEVFFPSAPAPFHGDAIFALKAGIVLPIALIAGMLLIFAVPVLRTHLDRATTCVTVAILGGWVVAWPLIAISTEYNGVYRYLAAACITALTVTLAFGWQTGLKLSVQPGWNKARWLGPLLLTALLFGYADELETTYGQIAPHDLANSINGRIYNWTSLTNRVLAAQASVPAEATILAYTDTPFLFDFVGNPILVADWPGESSPPPGLPVHQGGEAVAAYLLGQNIRYVIYSYKTEANFPRKVYQLYLEPNFGRVVNRTTTLSFAFQDDLAELVKTRSRLYDDGSLYVLDLAHKLPAKSALP
jgi:hypothetical protein